MNKKLEIPLTITMFIAGLLLGLYDANLTQYFITFIGIAIIFYRINKMLRNKLMNGMMNLIKQLDQDIKDQKGEKEFIVFKTKEDYENADNLVYFKNQKDADKFFYSDNYHLLCTGLQYNKHLKQLLKFKLESISKTT